MLKIAEVSSNKETLICINEKYGGSSGFNSGSSLPWNLQIIYTEHTANETSLRKEGIHGNSSTPAVSLSLLI